MPLESRGPATGQVRPGTGQPRNTLDPGPVHPVVPVACPDQRHPVGPGHRDGLIDPARAMSKQACHVRRRSPQSGRKRIARKDRGGRVVAVRDDMAQRRPARRAENPFGIGRHRHPPHPRRRVAQRQTGYADRIVQRHELQKARIDAVGRMLEPAVAEAVAHDVVVAVVGSSRQRVTASPRQRLNSAPVGVSITPQGPFHSRCVVGAAVAGAGNTRAAGTGSGAMGVVATSSTRNGAVVTSRGTRSRKSDSTATIIGSAWHRARRRPPCTVFAMAVRVMP